ncbi:hypothetical protein [Ruegeria sp. EL01]|jgi:F0F1-type ATP synthase assembly protein I|uniref:hypothetical protein n=1 Tax=Ruegeria sp. EL01 TaxID=2107578 RepID=UPI0013C45775|nr:hypothetical protein [Ruegeria sp. EL01]
MLKSVLVANAASCALFGLIFVLKGPTVSDFLGSPPTVLLYVIGAGLLVNAVFLAMEARRDTPRAESVRSFAIGDGIWVLLSIVLVVTGTWITNGPGIAWTIAVAVFVGICGFLQFTLTGRRAL